MDLVFRLNALNQHHYRDSPDVLAAWETARNVFGPVRATRPTPEPDPEGPPVTPPLVTTPGEKAG